MISRISSATRMIFAVGLTLAVPALAAASVTVDNISLKKQGEFTEITVYTSGNAEYTHEIVEPGGGKPYRVVLDVQDAVHNLPHYNFNGLPSETITSIRTSQYSVAPDKVFRLVADVKGNVTYKVRQTANSITIAVATPKDKEFQFWCAQPLNEADKLQLALDGKPNSEEASKQSAAKVEQEKPKSVEKKAVNESPKTEPAPTLVSSRVSGDPSSGPKLPPATESAPKPELAVKETDNISEATAEKTGRPSEPAAKSQVAEVHEPVAVTKPAVQNTPVEERKQPETKPVNQKAFEKMPLATAAFRETGEVTEAPATPTEPAAKPSVEPKRVQSDVVAPLAATPVVPEQQPVLAAKPETEQTAKTVNVEPAPKSDQTSNVAVPKSALSQAHMQPQGTANQAEDVPAGDVAQAEPTAPSVLEQSQRNALGDTSSGVGAPRAPRSDSASGEGEPPMQKPPALPEGVKDEDIYRPNPDSPTKTTGTLADRFPKRAIVEYESWDKADPFTPLVDQPMGGKGADGTMPDVESLRLVGVLAGEHGSSALFEDLEGYGYILKDGDPVKNGYVVQIADDKVVFQIEEYGWSRTIALRMEKGQ